MQIEVDNPSDTEQLLTVKVYDGGIFATHNYPCTVCRENVAVLDLSTGIMQPCWKCQRSNYRVVKQNWIQRFAERYKNGRM